MQLYNKISIHQKTMYCLKYFVIIITFFCTIFTTSVAQTFDLIAIQVSGNEYNVQASFTGNASCEYSVDFTCSTCSPSSISCSGVTNSVSCTVTMNVLSGNNVIQAVFTRVSGSAIQCPQTFTVSTSVLPITMKLFDVVPNDKFINLHWITSSEINNDYFEIEKSMDGITFYSIGRIEGSGNSYVDKDYSFQDYNIVPGFNYYRLKQVDYDGNYSFSEVKSANIRSSNTAEIYPNFTQDLINIVTPLDNYNIHISDAFGKNVFNLYGQIGNIQLNMENFESGIYFIEIAQDPIFQTKRVIKL